MCSFIIIRVMELMLVLYSCAECDSRYPAPAAFERMRAAMNSVIGWHLVWCYRRQLDGLSRASHVLLLLALVVIFGNYTLTYICSHFFYSFLVSSFSLLYIHFFS
jgi:hypothetical protein